MKKTQLLIIILFSFIFIFPCLLGLCNPRRPSPLSDVSQSSTSDAEIFTVSCLNTKTNNISEVNLEDHLVGVLAAEMPASYEPEALKAQAVAARSYILSKLDKTNSEHPDAAICTDPTHCKGWLSETDAKDRWSDNEKNSNWQKLRTAVISTSGEYMLYDDQAVEACFFASGGSRTENSEDVWQASLPYLRSVENNEYSDTTLSQTTFKAKEFIQILNNTGIQLPTDSTPTVSDISRTDGGAVASIKLCGKTFKGTEIRKIFGLKSANFTITVNADSVTFDVIGNGHGVGMSQKGANTMAKNGKNYTEILLHYYTNIQIVKM